ncbi:MAG: phosphate acyltransferase PlsX [Oscillospiraceae bacterium]|nr:phosphate acyltransferase PlsX [Oscillospiraceae bacterium]
MRIVIDAMGGDNAPDEIVKGAADAARELGITVVLTGDEQTVMQKLDGLSYPKGSVEVVHASQVVLMEDEGPTVMRTKKDSSMMVGLKLLKDGSADAMVSAGNTGALLTCATLTVGRVKGVRRAAIATVLPTSAGHCILLDSGANAECTPEFLLQFAFMGSYYARMVLGLKNPTVGLLNNGTEEIKGPPSHREAHALLSAAAQAGEINFIGNIEAREVPRGGADVVVADGFSGNILMKGIEGTAQLITGMMKEMFLKNALTKIAALSLKGQIAEMKGKMDYREVGGAPLIGLKGGVIKAHGSSDARAIRNAAAQAVRYASSGVIGFIGENISLMQTEK